MKEENGVKEKGGKVRVKEKKEKLVKRDEDR